MSDAEIAYKHYRFYITETVRMDYARVESIKLYESISRSAVNVATSLLATATSSGNYNTNTTPEKVFDEALNQYWESNQTTAPKWIKLSFLSPRPIRAFSISSKGDAREYPVSFKLQASNNDIDWVDLYETNSNTINGKDLALYLDISGVSKLDNGNQSSRVLVYDWLTGDLIKSITPSFDGVWSCPLRYDDDVLVTHLGTSGYEPKSDGPIKPYSRK